MGWFVAAIACLAIGAVLVRRARRRVLDGGHYGDGAPYVPVPVATEGPYGDGGFSGGGGDFGGGGASASWGDAGGSGDSGGGDGGGGGGD